MKYQVMIEKMDEEFYLIEEFNNLDDAVECAKKYPREKYKTIWIQKIDEKDNLIKTIEIEVR